MWPRQIKRLGERVGKGGREANASCCYCDVVVGQGVIHHQLQSSREEIRHCRAEAQLQWNLSISYFQLYIYIYSNYYIYREVLCMYRCIYMSLQSFYDACFYIHHHDLHQHLFMSINYLYLV